MGVVLQTRSERRFDAGRVLGQSFSTFFGNFSTFVLMTTLVRAPVIAFALYLAASVRDGDDVAKTLERLQLVSLVGGLVLGPLATATVTYGVLQQLRGERASLGACFRVGLRRMHVVLGVDVATLVLVVLGAIALIVPGIIAALAFSVAAPAAVVERLGVHDAMNRSAQLTRGYRFTIFCVFFVFGVINTVGTKVLELGFLGAPVSVPGLEGYIIGFEIVSVLTTTLRAVADAVIYHDLRVEKEGLDTEAIASVFD